MPKIIPPIELLCYIWDKSLHCLNAIYMNLKYGILLEMINTYQVLIANKEVLVQDGNLGESY